MPEPTRESARDATRSGIVETTSVLLRERGPGAVTTRAVAEAAGVQAPTIYRLFGDKDGLIDAVAEHAYARHVAAKSRSTPTEDPVADLRTGWDTHVGFGLANPALAFMLSDPERAGRSPAVAAGLAVLRERVHRVALAGRLMVAEVRAVELVHAAGTGAVLALLAVPPGRRDPGLADAMYDAVAGVVLADEAVGAADATGAALVAVRAAAPGLQALTVAERHLLVEWLDRGAAPPAG